MDLEMQFSIGGVKRPARRPAGAGPRRLLVVGDFGGRARLGLIDGAAGEAGARAPLRTRQEDLDAAVAAIAPRVVLSDLLAGEPLVIPFAAVDDFHPDALYARVRDRRLAEILPASSPSLPASPSEADADTLARLLGSRGAPAAARPREAGPVGALIDRIVAAHGAAVPASASGPSSDVQAQSRTLRAVLHHPAFQELESLWRGMQLLVSRVDEPVEVWLLDLAKDELSGGRAGEALLERSLLAPPRGGAWSGVVAAFTFGPGAADLALLGRIGAWAAQAGAPVVAGAGPGLLGCASLSGQSDPALWPGLTGDDAARWQALRRSPAAGSIGLALPRFLARAPYGAKSGAIEAFRFEEVDGEPRSDQLLWGNPAFLCALRLAAEPESLEAGAGEDAGASIDDLPFFSYRVAGEVEMYPPAELFWGERAVAAALARGLIPLMGSRDRNAVRLPALRSIADPPVDLI
jgi:hypothetical protein